MCLGKNFGKFFKLSAVSYQLSEKANRKSDLLSAIRKSYQPPASRKSYQLSVISYQKKGESLRAHPKLLTF